jgi:hypothetical protein
MRIPANMFRLLIAFVLLAVAQEVLTNDSVVTMVKSGLGEALIVNMIQGQPGRYLLAPDELVRLKGQGVPRRSWRPW